MTRRTGLDLDPDRRPTTCCTPPACRRGTTPTAGTAPPPARTLRDTAPGRRIPLTAATFHRAYLPLGKVDKDQPPLIDMLRAGRHLDRRWVAIDLDGSPLLPARQVPVLDHSDDIAPTRVRWTPAMVT